MITVRRKVLLWHFHVFLTKQNCFLEQHRFGSKLLGRVSSDVFSGNIDSLEMGNKSLIVEVVLLSCSLVWSWWTDGGLTDCHQLALQLFYRKLWNLVGGRDLIANFGLKVFILMSKHSNPAFRLLPLLMCLNFPWSSGEHLGHLLEVMGMKDLHRHWKLENS